jgi:hypothetical protein
MPFGLENKMIERQRLPLTFLLTQYKENGGEKYIYLILQRNYFHAANNFPMCDQYLLSISDVMRLHYHHHYYIFSFIFLH